MDDSLRATARQFETGKTATPAHHAAHHFLVVGGRGAAGGDDRQFCHLA